MATKKKLSLALAFVMSLSLLATGCKKTNEDSDGISGISETTIITPATTTEAPETITQATTTTTAATTTTTAPEETESETESESESESESETTTVSESETETTTEEREWTETEISGVMYTTQACWSRKKAIVGSEGVDQYLPGTTVNVVAYTDTEYYKLADGSYIHSDYLSDDMPENAEVTTQPKVTAAVTEESTATKKPSSTTKKTVTTTETEPTFIFPEDTTPAETTAGKAGYVVPISYNKSYKSKYAYKQLSADEQKLYGDIVDAAMSLRTRVAVPNSLLSDDIFKVYSLVFNQEPQLFWLSRSLPSGYGSIRLSYEYDLDTIIAMQYEIDKTANSLLASANKYSQTASKLKVFYDWIVTHNEFSKSETSATCGIYNGLTPGKSLQCAGYAKSMLYLCDMAGIDCMVIPGTNTAGLSHAWNKVYCGDGWYNLDATWGDPENSFGPDYIRYNFFLVPDEWIKNDHLSPNVTTRSNGNTIKYFDPPACTKSTYNYFRMYNKEFSTYDEALQGLYDEIDAAIKEKRITAHIRVTDKKIWDKLTAISLAKTLNAYVKEKGAAKISVPQVTANDGVLVVQYDIYY